MKRRKSGPRFRIGTGDRFAYQGCTAALWALADLAEVYKASVPLRRGWRCPGRPGEAVGIVQLHLHEVQRGGQFSQTAQMEGHLEGIALPDRAV